MKATKHINPFCTSRINFGLSRSETKHAQLIKMCYFWVNWLC